MPKLKIAPIKQAHENSCWAACMRMALTHYKGAFYASDEDLAKAMRVKVDRCQDAGSQLKKARMFGGTDDTDVKPPMDELKAEIDAGRPIIQCVNTTQVAPGASSRGGHYILINGYDEPAGTITYIDPSTALERTVTYTADAIVMNGVPMYFAQPYYTEAP